MKKSILFSVLVVGATLLQAQSITVHQTCGQNGQVTEVLAVDLGLSVKWSNKNVGAESPEGYYGDYFAWGETATKENYDRTTYFDTNDGGNTFTKYNNNGGKTVLDQEDDAAYVNWGGSWRIPTNAEWQELLDNCTWTWTTQNGINGYKVTSNKAGYTDKFIFLPAAGWRYGSHLYNVGSRGYYWSSALSGSNSRSAWDLLFGSDYRNLDNFSIFRYHGLSVRPVLQPSSISYSSSTNDTIRIYSNGCDDYQTFIGSHGSQFTMTAQSDQWSHFVRWNDGNTDNPRTITTNGNADYTAYFEVYKYSVQVQSNDAARGRAYISKVVKDGTIDYDESVGTFDAGSEVFLAYQANYGYHFDKWSDGNTSQLRSFILAKDTTFTATFAKNVYSITTNAEHGTISGNSSAEYLDKVTLSVSSDYGYHFVRWNDGNTDNPRTIILASDTSFTAEFAKNTYTISTTSANPEWGTTAGDTAVLYLDEVEISATANYGYHFVHWSDSKEICDYQDYDWTTGRYICYYSHLEYNTDNPRTVTLTQDTVFSAIFIPNKYTISDNSNQAQGAINGVGIFNYLSQQELTAIPKYGYHFAQWSDGITDNPRTITLTKDTTFTAEFAVDTNGKCGDNLVWELTDNVLTILGSGAMWDEQPWVISRESIERVNLPQSLTYIGNDAFNGLTALTALAIPSSVESIGWRSFYNCNNITSFEGPLVAYDQINPNKLKTVVINGGNTTDLSLYFWQSASLEHLDLAAVETSTFPRYLLNGFINIEELVLPAHIENIGYMSVAECMELKEIAIPASVIEIEKRAFEDCRNLAKIEFAEGSQLQTIGDWAFYNCHELAQLAIPEGVTEIGKAAFYGCTYLADVKLPASVQELGDNAFALCSKMKRMDVDALLPPTIAAKTFEDVSRQMPVYVPDESIDLYKADALWGEMNIIGKHESPMGIDNTSADQPKATKILRDGQILILRGDKTYTITGQEVK